MQWKVQLTPALGVIPVEVNQLLSRFDHLEVSVIVHVESSDRTVIDAIEEAASQQGVELTRIEDWPTPAAIR